MAATDQHYRNQKTLDIVFAVSCAAMLLSTIWMFAQDFYRDFKSVQRKFRDVEATMAEREMIDRLPDRDEVKAKQKALTRARGGLEKKRDELAARNRELTAERDLADERYRTKKADIDAQSSYYNIAIDEAGSYPKGSPTREAQEARARAIAERIATLQGQLDAFKKELDAIDKKIRDEVRDKLRPYEDAVAQAEDEMKKIAGNFDRFAKVAAQKSWGLGDAFRALPILDAFESPIKIRQQWLPDLTIDYSFKDVPRYDRCTTCHLGIDRGNFDRAALKKLTDKEENKRLLGKLETAQEIIEQRESRGEKLGYTAADLPGEYAGSATATRIFGQDISVTGAMLLLFVISSLIAAVTLGVLEKSWRLGVKVMTIGLLITLVSTGAVVWAAPKVPTVKTVDLKEGDITQFCVHPRLDLYVDSNSPHPTEKFGCTICHAGQGSATDFNLASHTPTDAVQEKKWKKEHDYSAGHFWDFPMLSKRFTESSCLKCHHQVTDLIRNGSKEEAPKLLRGYNLIREMGCFGCHEISGIKSGRTVGPDLRLEPAPALDYLSAAEQERVRSDAANPPGAFRKVGPSLRRLAEKTNLDWTTKWINAPRGFREDTKMPHFYNLITNSPENLPADQKTYPAAEIHSMAHYLIAESKAHLAPKGPEDTYRRLLLGGKAKEDAQPAEKGLRDLTADLKAGRLDDRGIKELFDVSKRFADLALLSSPMQNRAINDTATRMRQVQERINDTWKRQRDAEDPALKTSIGEMGKELDGLVASLEQSARPTSVLTRIIDGEGKTVTLPAKEGDATRGRTLFTEKGCLACHAHQGTATNQKSADGKGTLNYSISSEANFAPELSRIADKLSPALDKVTARTWLVQWLLNPNVHHPRTRMPITHLSPTDANDVATWLLSQKTGWKGPETDPKAPTLADYKSLARVYLAKAPGVTSVELEEFLPAEGTALPGIKKDRLERFARDAEERALEEGKVTEDTLKWYIGKKTIGRLGCYACHDIPGFEVAKPIGTGLNDWGKKDAERLAFEDADNFVKSHFNIVPTRKSRLDVEGQLVALWKQGAAGQGDKLTEWLDKPQSITRVVELLNQYQKDEKIADEAVLDKETADLLTSAENRLSKRRRDEIERLKTQLTKQERIHQLEEKEKSKEGLTSEEAKELHDLHPLKLYERARDASGHELAPMEETFAKLLEHHHQRREGFLNLKLEQPRAYDYNRRLKWDDRLRMPQFKFGRTRRLPNESDAAYQARADKDEAEAREAVMTFILGLVAEPIPLKYVHNPKPDKAAEVAGRQVLDKYNCGGCHQIRPGLYDFKVTPSVLLREVEGQKKGLQVEYESAMATDRPIDHVYLNHSAWFGTAPTSDRLTAVGYLRKQAEADEIWLTEALRFYGTDRLLRDLPAGSKISVPEGVQITAPYGGTWSDLMPAYLKRKNSTLFDTDEKARGVLPPPLVREGERVQSDWLYRFLLNPQPIRPQSYILLRMPKFNMSLEESRALVNYFAAASRLTNPGAGVTAPFVNIEQRDPDFWNRTEADYQQRLKEMREMVQKNAKDTKDDAARKKWEARLALVDEAMKRQKEVPQNARVKDFYSREAFNLVPICMECHSVGNVKIKTEEEKGPNLILTAERLRPEWTEMWIAHPKRLFTYPPLMPQNFQNNPDPLEWKWQDRFVGTPHQQLRAVRDLLMDQPRLTDLLATEKLKPIAAGGQK